MGYVVDKTSLNTSYEYDLDNSLDDLYNYNKQARFDPGKKIRGADFNTLLKADQTAYGARFNTLISLARAETDTGNLKPISVFNAVGDPDRWDLTIPAMLYTIPSPIPGSAGVTGTNSGTTLATRGGLSCWSRGKNVIINYVVQRCALNGTGGLTLAGTASTGQTVHGGSYAWEGTEDLSTGPGPQPFLLYPDGSKPGDLFRIQVAIRQADSNLTGFLSALVVHETPLSSTR